MIVSFCGTVNRKYGTHPLPFLPDSIRITSKATYNRALVIATATLCISFHRILSNLVKYQQGPRSFRWPSMGNPTIVSWHEDLRVF